MDLKEFQALKAQVDRARDQSSQAQGALNQLLKRLTSEYGCDTVEEAQAKLEDLRKIAAAADVDFADKCATFQKHWKGVTG